MDHFDWYFPIEPVKNAAWVLNRVAFLGKNYIRLKATSWTRGQWFESIIYMIHFHTIVTQFYTDYLFIPHSKKKVFILYGKWTECMYIVDPVLFETQKKNDKKMSEDKKSSKQVFLNVFTQHLSRYPSIVMCQTNKAKCQRYTTCFYNSFLGFSQLSQTTDSEETPQPGGDSLDVIPGSQLLWRIPPRPANSVQVCSKIVVTLRNFVPPFL